MGLLTPFETQRIFWRNALKVTQSGHRTVVYDIGQLKLYWLYIVPQQLKNILDVLVFSLLHDDLPAVRQLVSL